MQIGTSVYAVDYLKNSVLKAEVIETDQFSNFVAQSFKTIWVIGKRPHQYFPQINVVCWEQKDIPDRKYRSSMREAFATRNEAIICLNEYYEKQVNFAKAVAKNWDRKFQNSLTRISD